MFLLIANTQAESAKITGSWSGFIADSHASKQPFHVFRIGQYSCTVSLKAS